MKIVFCLPFRLCVGAVPQLPRGALDRNGFEKESDSLGFCGTRKRQVLDIGIILST